MNQFDHAVGQRFAQRSSVVGGTRHRRARRRSRGAAHRAGGRVTWCSARPRRDPRAAPVLVGRAGRGLVGDIEQAVDPRNCCGPRSSGNGGRRLRRLHARRRVVGRVGGLDVVQVILHAIEHGVRVRQFRLRQRRRDRRGVDQRPDVRRCRRRPRPPGPRSPSARPAPAASRVSPRSARLNCRSTARSSALCRAAGDTPRRDPVHRRRVDVQHAPPVHQALAGGTNRRSACPSSPRPAAAQERRLTATRSTIIQTSTHGLFVLTPGKPLPGYTHSWYYNFHFFPTG